MVRIDCLPFLDGSEVVQIKAVLDVEHVFKRGFFYVHS